MRQVKKDSINVSVDVYIIDATAGTPELGVLWNTAGMDLEYRREGAAVVNITEATLAALTTAHTDGGFLEIGHGLYRLDVPDAAFATGAETISIQGTVTGMIVLPQTIQLVDFDPEDGVRLGLTALPNAAAEAPGGLYTRGTGAGQIGQSANGQVNVNVTRLNNVAQSLLDLVNFADSGYDPATNKVQGLVLADTVTTLTNLPTIPANWLTAAGIAASALNGKGDWNINKTGYSLSTAGILAVWHQALTAIVTAGSVGKLLKDEITSARMATLTDWINGGRLDLLLDAIPTTAMRGTDGALTDKAGFSLSAAGTLAIWHELLTSIVTAGSIGKLLKDEVTPVRMATLSDWIDAGRLDALLDEVKIVTDKFVFTVANIVDANTLRINSNAESPVILDRAVRATTRFTVGAASTITSIVTSSMDPAAAAIDQFKGLIVKFDKDTITANLRGQGTDITGNTAAGVLTVTALTTAPVSGDTGTIE